MPFYKTEQTDENEKAKCQIVCYHVTKNLQVWEDCLLDGPYIHHFVEIEGDYTAELKEFCKYFPNLKMYENIKKINPL